MENACDNFQEPKWCLKMRYSLCFLRRPVFNILKLQSIIQIMHTVQPHSQFQAVFIICTPINASSASFFIKLSNVKGFLLNIFFHESNGSQSLGGQNFHLAKSNISRALIIQSILNANVTNLSNSPLRDKQRHQSSISLKPFSSARELTLPLVLQLHAWFTQAAADSGLFPAC